MNILTKILVTHLTVVGVLSAAEFSTERLTLPTPIEHPHTIASISPLLFDQSRWTYISLADEVNCMALNLYFEARNQDKIGQIAVGLVTINRVLSAAYPNNICDVVWQRNKTKKGKWVAQFSWTLDGLHDDPRELDSWKNSKHIAGAMLLEGDLFTMEDFTNNSTHYHADYVTPFWSKHLQHTITVGNHIFYQNTPCCHHRQK